MRVQLPRLGELYQLRSSRLTKAVCTQQPDGLGNCRKGEQFQLVDAVILAFAKRV